jgi:serine/threonine protein kinase
MILNNKYFINNQIAQGGFCDIYEGFIIDEKEGLLKDYKIAIKIPNDEMMNKSDISLFLYCEFFLLKSLKHTNIVKVIDFGIDSNSDKPYLVLEYLEGELLSNVSYENLTLSKKNSIFYQLIKTLKYIHFEGIVHGDISPTNIIIVEEKPILIDFGISYSLRNNISLDYNNYNVYNPKYSASDLIKGNLPSFNSDIYSLSIIIYELYTKNSIFSIFNKKILTFLIKIVIKVRILIK